MNDMSYFKLKADGKTTCFSTDFFDSPSEVIATLNAAVKTGSEGAELVDFFLTHSSNRSPISDIEWDEKESAQELPTPHERTVSLDFDADRAVFSQWSGNVRTLLSGAIYRLTGCYEMALSEKGFDSSSFVANLVQHCSLQCIEHKPYPPFVMSGMI